jgi:flagellar hook assembly protein FlgD
VIRDGGGAVVRTLEEQGAVGLHRVVWDLRDEDRHPVSPGSYSVTLEAGGGTQHRILTVKPPVVLPRG